MTLNPLIQQLIAQGPVLTDGAWGTQLQARGLAPGEVPDLWNLTHPEKVTPSRVPMSKPVRKLF
jgi:methionine synthase I (cobalamin-dependent)